VTAELACNLAGGNAEEDQEEGKERAATEQHEEQATDQERTFGSPRARSTALLSGSVAPTVLLSASARLLDELCEAAFWLFSLWRHENEELDKFLLLVEGKGFFQLFVGIDLKIRKVQNFRSSEKYNVKKFCIIL
jgi:hypothetical protein